MVYADQRFFSVFLFFKNIEERRSWFLAEPKMGMEYDLNNMGSRIRERREAKGLTQDDIVNIVGVGKTTISAYENGKVDISISRLVDLANVLETTVSYLIGETDDPRPKEKKQYSDQDVLNTMAMLGSDFTSAIITLAANKLNGVKGK